MFRYKLSVIALASSVTLLASCNTINEYYQYVSGDVDTSLREPTGYYEHEKVKDVNDQLVVPQGLNNPISDKSLEIQPASANFGPTGEEMDIRAPIVPLRSNLGIEAQWVNNEAIVWLEPYGTHGIKTERQAWELLDKVLRTMGVKVGTITQGAYELTTVASDFNEYGKPYTGVDTQGLRYSQIYRIRIGRGESGAIGIATSLIGSLTKLSSGRGMDNILSQIEQQRFAMGFSNEIITTLDTVNSTLDTMPDVVSITLDRDNNDQDCFVVNASYTTTWEVLRQMLPNYSFIINEYSISNSLIKVEYDEEDREFFAKRGVDSFNLESGNYIIRVAVEENKSIITFYDEDDKPLKTNTVTALYPGFSKALLKAFEKYNNFGISSSYTIK